MCFRTLFYDYFNKKSDAAGAALLGYVLIPVSFQFHPVLPSIQSNPISSLTLIDWIKVRFQELCILYGLWKTLTQFALSW